MKNKISNIYIDNKKVILAVTITLLSLVLLWQICPIMYQNNDDKFLLYMIAGYTTGKPEMATIFGGFLWAKIIGLLYQLYNGITWYTLASIVVIGFSIAVINRSLITSNKTKVIVLDLVFMLAIFAGMLAYFSTAIQYTMTAAYAGTAGCCMLLIALREQNASRLHVVLSVVLLALSYSIRKQMGLVVLSCYCFVLLFGYFKYAKKIVVKYAIVIFLVFGLVYSSNYIYEKATGLSEFNCYYSIVQGWIDYPHVDIKDDEKLYNSVDWDKELYDAATEWFFLDERVNEEAFTILNSAIANDELSFNQKLSGAIDALANKQIINMQVLIWFFILVVFNIVALKKCKKELLFVDSVFIFFLLLSAYFCIYKGRFPLRVYQALVLIYGVPSLSVMWMAIEDCKYYKTKITVGITMLLIVVCSFKFYPAGSMVHELKLATHDGDRQHMIEAVTNLEEYACSHKNNIYIYDYELSQPADPFVNFGNESPYNVMFWGGWTYNSPVYFKQLKANGLDELKPDDLINSNIYICGMYHDEVIYNYMKSRFGKVEIEDVDSVGDVLIYRYTR